MGRIASSCKHNMGPTGYVEQQAWLEWKTKRYKQTQCPKCGLWAIWKVRPAPPCSVEDCKRKYYAKGYCNVHWQRLTIFGDPLADVPVRRRHGRAYTPEYIIWQGMLYRCHNVKNRAYADYGGRGIKVCDRWRGYGGFERFFEDMGPRPSSKHSIDRIDNDGDYAPDNCRWATSREQSYNKRNTVRYEGKTKLEWAEELGVPYKTFCGYSVRHSMAKAVEHYKLKLQEGKE